MPFVEEQGFQARAFADVGSLWNVGADTDNIAVFDSSAPRFSMGVGITWDSPIGPLSVDYGIAFNVQEGDVVQNVRFAIASGFWASAILLCLIVDNEIDGAEPYSDTISRCVKDKTRTR